MAVSAISAFEQWMERAGAFAADGRNQQMRIVVDAMGGDLAPQVNVEGAVNALREFKDVEIILVGQEAEIRKCLKDWDDVKDRLSIVDAPDVITTHEHPVMALRKKPNSSLVVGMNIVRRKEAEAFVSAGSTGAIMAGAMFKIGRIDGIDRPALAPVLPAPKKPLLLIDAGANVDCHPDWLVQFGLMGSVYMEKVMGVKEPEVGLINIGEEAEKGDDRAKKTYALMAAGQPYKFIGNVEAREILSGQADVLACDGFVGNVVLKYTEGMASTMFGMIKTELMKSLRGKLGALLAKPAFRAIKHSMDSTEVGGAPLLGVEGAVVKAHGNSNARAIFCAIRQARRMVEGDVVGIIRREVANLTLESKEEENN